MKHIQRYLVLLLIWNLITSGMHPVSGQDVVYTENHDSTEFVQASDTIQKSDFLNSYSGRILVRFDKSPLFVSILYVVILYSIVTLITIKKSFH